MPKRADRNQAEIVEALRGIGASVVCTHMVGNGFPDLVVCFRGVNFLIEVKDWQQEPRKRKLTPDEQEFHSTWGGPVAVVETVEDAFVAVGAQAQLFK